MPCRDDPPCSGRWIASTSGRGRCVVCVPLDEADKAIAVLESAGETVYRIGRIESAEGEPLVRYSES